MPVSHSSDKTAPGPVASALTSWALPSSYTDLQNGFGWQVPAQFNIAQVCSRRWASLPDALNLIAIRAYKTEAESTFYSYAQLQRDANRLSHVLIGMGVRKGDRVAIVLPQCFETAVAYMAVCVAILLGNLAGGLFS